MLVIVTWSLPLPSSRLTTSIVVFVDDGSICSWPFKSWVTTIVLYEIPFGMIVDSPNAVPADQSGRSGTIPNPVMPTLVTSPTLSCWLESSKTLSVSTWKYSGGCGAMFRS